MANQVWNRLGQITSNYKNSQQAPSLNNNQYSSYYSKLYPGLNEGSYNKMVNAVDSLGLTGENRTNAMNNYYRTHVKTLINDQTLQERDGIINQQAYEAAKLNNKDADAELRMTEAVQKAKKLWNLDATANDREVFSTMVETLGADGVKLAGQYLSGENDEFLYKTGLEQREVKKPIEVTGGDIWDNIRTKANVPIDTMKKWGQRTFDKMGAMLYKNVLKNVLGDSTDGKVGDVDEYVDFFSEKVIDPKLKENALNYQQGINERYQALEQKNMDQDVKNYYDNKGYTELIGEGDLKGFMYKSLGDAAQNWEMPVVVAASVVQPEIGLALMTTDSYARENQEAFENMLNNGATYEEAENGAVAVGLINAAVEVTLEKLIGGVETTAGDAIRKTLMKNVQEEATKKGLGRILLEGAGTQLRASGEEGLEEIVQQIVQNAAVKTVNENQELFEGVGQAFEGGFYNPMNLLAGGGNLTQNISQNTDTINQQLGDTAYNAGVMTRNIVDGFTDAGSFMKDKATAIKQMAKEWLNRKNGQNVTTENVETESTAITPQGTETTLDNSVTETNNKGDKATLKEELYSIDPTLKKNLQNNPYSAEVWQKTKDYIDKNGRPERSNDVAKALIEDVADRVQAKLMEKMDEGGETGKLYKPLKEAGFTVDLTELKNGIDEMLEGFGIEIEDGKLNFDKTAIDGSEASNIRKIYNWLQTTNAPMGITEYLERFRRTLTDMVDFNPNGRDQTGRKVADTPGDKVLKKIRTKANDLAHNQISELAELDKEFNEWVKVMDEVSDGLVYKDKTKKGVIRDNITQIIKNLDEPTRRQLANRLEKIMPGIREEVNAINQMPKVIDHYYNPSKLQQGLTSEGLKAFGSLGGLPGYLLTRWGGAKISEKIDSFKSKAWDEVLQETSEEGKAKMQEIQAKIEENKRLTKEQEARLQGLKDRLLEKMATMDKTDAEQAAWESYLADLEQDEVIDMPEEVYDQWEEVTTTPKKKTTKKKTSKKTVDVDKNTQEKIDAYEKEINKLVEPYRMADNSVNLSDFMKDKKAYSKYTKIMDEVRKLQGYMTEDGMYTQKRYDMLNKRKEEVYGKQVSTWAETEDEVKSKKKTSKKS